MRPGRRVVIGSGALGLGLVLWFGGPALLRRMSIFQVRRVEVTGARYLGAAEVARALGLGRQANLFDPVAPLARRAAAMPGVASAEVHRRLPGTLEVAIREAEPVGLAPGRQPAGAGELVLVDRRGRELPFDPTRAATDLPLVAADSSVTGLVDRLRELDTDLSAAIMAASREKDDIVIETAHQRLLFRVGAGTKELVGAAAVWAEVGRRRMEVAVLDARFAGRVIARKKAG